MVQDKGSRTSPTSASHSGCLTTTNSPAPSQANRTNMVKFNCRVREPDVITAVWELAPASLARTIKIEITTGDVSKTAKLLLPTDCPHLKVTLQTDSFNRFLRVSVDLPRATGKKTEVPSDRLQPFPRQEQKVDSITIVNNWGVKTSQNTTQHTLHGSELDTAYLTSFRTQHSIPCIVQNTIQHTLHSSEHNTAYLALFRTRYSIPYILQNTTLYTLC